MELHVWQVILHLENQCHTHHFVVCVILAFHVKFTVEFTSQAMNFSTKSCFCVREKDPRKPEKP